MPKANNVTPYDASYGISHSDASTINVAALAIIALAKSIENGDADTRDALTPIIRERAEMIDSIINDLPQFAECCQEGGAE